jgi:SseB protein N-terminal domain
MIPNGGTFVRPGAIAWDGLLSPSPASAGRAQHFSCEVVEQAIAAALADLDRLPDLLDALAEARLWLPLPDGPKPVTDGSAIVLPVMACPHPAGEGAAAAPGEGCDLVPAFTSVQRLGTWSDPRALRADPAATAGPLRSGDPARVRDIAAGTGVVRHIVVPFPGLVSRLPPEVGIAINPGSGLGVQLCPAAIACLAGQPPARPRP